MKPIQIQIFVSSLNSRAVFWLCSEEVPSFFPLPGSSVMEGLNAYYLFVAFSTCQSNVSGWGLFCFCVAGTVQDAPSCCNYGSIIVLAQKHLLSPCNLHFLVSLENFMDPDDLLFSMTSQCTQLFLLCSPVSPSTSFFPISISNAFGISAHLLIKSISRRRLCAAAAGNAALCPPLLGCLPSEHNASPSSCLEPLLFSFNILKSIFSAFLF